MLRRVFSSSCSFRDLFPPLSLAASSATCAGLVSKTHTFFTRQQYEASIADPVAYWQKASEKIDWFVPPAPHEIAPDFASGDEYGVAKSVGWFRNAKVNLCYNAVDRHVAAGLGHKVAYYVFSPATGMEEAVTYAALLDDVCLLARVLRQQLGIKQGDRVAAYLPNCRESIVTSFACERIGAVSVVIFGGFAAHELARRCVDADCSAIVTCSGGVEGGKIIDYIPAVQEAVKIVNEHKKRRRKMKQQEQTSSGSDFIKVLFKQRMCAADVVGLQFRQGVSASQVFASEDAGPGFDWDDCVRQAKQSCLCFASAAATSTTKEASFALHSCMVKPSPGYLASAASSAYFLPCEQLNGDTLSSITYTSGTTGAPKGIMRDTAGYAVALAHSFEFAMGLHQSDVIFAFANVGWVLGISYIRVAPAIVGATSVLLEGHPTTSPKFGPDLLWHVLEKYRVNMLLTAPTTIRAIRAVTPAAGRSQQQHQKVDLSQLRRTYLAGERADVPTIRWMTEQTNRPTQTQWWQTETASPVTASSLPFSEEEARVFSRRTGGIGHVDGAEGRPVMGWQLSIVKDETAKKSQATDDDGAAARDNDGDDEAASSSTGEIVAKLPLPPGTLIGIWGDQRKMYDVYCSRGYYRFFDAGRFVCATATDAETAHEEEEEEEVVATTTKTGDPTTGFVEVLSRTDDVVNVAGHRLATGEFEAVIMSCPASGVVEAAVTARPHPVKGLIPVCFVVLRDSAAAPPEQHAAIAKRLQAIVREEIGPIAVCDVVITKKLPKTKSGKILRRLLKAIAEGEKDTKKLPVAPTIEDETSIAACIEAFDTMCHRA